MLTPACSTRVLSAIPGKFDPIEIAHSEVIGMDVKVSNPGVAPFARAILVYCRERKSGISRIHKDRVTNTAHPLLALYPETTNPG